MLTTLAVANHRPPRELIVPLGRLNLVVGAFALAPAAGVGPASEVRGRSASASRS